MSTSPETELDLDSLFLPAWAQQPANKNLYAKYEGKEERYDDRRGDRGRRPQHDRAPGQREQRGPRPLGQERRSGGKPRRDFPPRGERRPERPAPEPLPDVDMQFRPDE